MVNGSYTKRKNNQKSNKIIINKIQPSALTDDQDAAPLLAHPMTQPHSEWMIHGLWATPHYCRPWRPVAGARMALVMGYDSVTGRTVRLVLCYYYGGPSSFRPVSLHLPLFPSSSSFLPFTSSSYSPLFLLLFLSFFVFFIPSRLVHLVAVRSLILPKIKKKIRRNAISWSEKKYHQFLSAGPNTL